MKEETYTGEKMDFDPLDKLAADYLNGDEQTRAKMVSDLRGPTPTFARIFLAAGLVILAVLLVAGNVFLANLPGDLFKINAWVYIIFNSLVVAGAAKVAGAYLQSRMVIYPLLKRFADRHPQSPLILRLRDTKGGYDWDKVVPMK